MPRRQRHATGQFIFHVLNRAVQHITLFEDDSDYGSFLRILTESVTRFPMRLLAYALMPTHWHLVLWPSGDDSLSPFMQALTGEHAQAWRRKKGSRGRGAVYQGRFKAIAVQDDAHFLRLCRYVERNPMRAKFVERAEEWPWASAFPAAQDPGRPLLASWPVSKPSNWHDQLNVPEPPQVLEHIRGCIRRGRHYGTDTWRQITSTELRWRTGLREPGRPPLVTRLPAQGTPIRSVIPEGRTGKFVPTPTSSSARRPAPP